MHAVQADPKPQLTPVHIARENDCHPSAPLRWIQKGAVLSSGERVKLKATRTPGGWRVKREDLEEFFEVLTADRLRPEDAAESKPPSTPARIQKLKAELSQAGF